MSKIINIGQDWSEWLNVCNMSIFFSALHAIPARTSDEIGVRPSISLSNACIVTKRKKIYPDFYTIRKII